MLYYLYRLLNLLRQNKKTSCFNEISHYQGHRFGFIFVSFMWDAHTHTHTHTKSMNLRKVYLLNYNRICIIHFSLIFNNYSTFLMNINLRLRLIIKTDMIDFHDNCFKNINV